MIKGRQKIGGNSANLLNCVQGTKDSDSDDEICNSTMIFDVSCTGTLAILSFLIEFSNSWLTFFPFFLKTKYPNVIFNSDKSFHQFRIPNVRTFIMNIFQPFKLRKSGGKISETNWRKQLMNFWENNRIQKLFLFKIHLWNYLFICRASWWGLEHHARNYFRRSVPILFSYLGYQ